MPFPGRTSSPCVLARPPTPRTLRPCIGVVHTHALSHRCVCTRMCKTGRAHARRWWGEGGSWRADGCGARSAVRVRLYAHLFVSLFQRTRPGSDQALKLRRLRPFNPQAAAFPRRQLPVIPKRQNRILLIRVLPPSHPLRPHVSPIARYVKQNYTFIHNFFIKTSNLIYNDPFDINLSDFIP